MSRSKLTNTSDDVVNDSGSVLFSFVKGEQLEFPIELNFITDATISGFTYEAVVIEADNVSGQTERPTSAKVSGVETTLTVRLPVLIGAWNASTAYSYENVVSYNSKYYKLKQGVGVVNATAPDLSPLWIETKMNIIYVQFPSTLASSWTIQPAVDFNSYGFFELAVTEPNNGIFRRTWKPVRGMVEIQFSPTEEV